MDFPESTFLYNEEEHAKTPKKQKEIFIYEWLRNLENDLSNSTRVSKVLKLYFISVLYFDIILLVETACEL